MRLIRIDEQCIITVFVDFIFKLSVTSIGTVSAMPGLTVTTSGLYGGHDMVMSIGSSPTSLKAPAPLIVLPKNSGRFAFFEYPAISAPLTVVITAIVVGIFLIIEHRRLFPKKSVDLNASTANVHDL